MSYYIQSDYIQSDNILSDKILYDDSIKNYELECSNVIYDSIILVMTPNINEAKSTIIRNIINTNLYYCIPNFKPYKSRLELNIPLLQSNIRHHLYSLLQQFYDVTHDIYGEQQYNIIHGSGATHQDVDELVFKMSDVLSNKLLGKDIIKQFSSENQFDFFL